MNSSQQNTEPEQLAQHLHMGKVQDKVLQQRIELCKCQRLAPWKLVSFITTTCWLHLAYLWQKQWGHMANPTPLPVHRWGEACPRQCNEPNRQWLWVNVHLQKGNFLCVSLSKIFKLSFLPSLLSFLLSSFLFLSFPFPSLPCSSFPFLSFPFRSLPFLLCTYYLIT